MSAVGGRGGVHGSALSPSLPMGVLAGVTWVMGFGVTERERIRGEAVVDPSHLAFTRSAQ